VAELVSALPEAFYVLWIRCPLPFLLSTLVSDFYLLLWFMGSNGFWDSTPQRDGDKRSLYMSMHLFVASVYLSLLLLRTCYTAPNSRFRDVNVYIRVWYIYWTCDAR
jgi:hypothetical protein